MNPRPGPVYGIADATALGGASPAAAAAAMARGGVSWVQLRAKEASDAELHELAAASARALEGTGALLWIDDRPDVAALVGAAGVHLGQEDLPPAAARRVVGDGVWIGRSTHDREQVLEADRDPDVDVIAVGPVFATASKERPDPVVGLELVAWARRATRKPLVAIGGIDASNLASVLAAGADAAAVLSALCRGDVEANARRLGEEARG
jgi:thiamine-phosphate pyrophosphorylase